MAIYERLFGEDGNSSGFYFTLYCTSYREYTRNSSLFGNNKPWYFLFQMKKRIINEDTILIDTVISAVDNIQNVLTKALEKVNPEGTKDIRERVFGHICSLTSDSIRQTLKIAEDKICRYI